MHYQILTNGTRIASLESHHVRSKRRKRKDRVIPRTEAIYGSKAYQDSLQRAFNRAKQQVYFNPDMTYFVTLTYKGSSHTPDDVLYDVKQYVKTERRKGNSDLKYIFVMEYQKRGSIHVHMITNSSFENYTNSNGYKSLTNWKHRFSSMLSIKDFDRNFRPYLYLFKYMRKAQRIGKSFLHTSRNLTNFHEVPYTDFDKSLYSETLVETTKAVLPDGTKRTFIRRYYEQTINLQRQEQENRQGFYSRTRRDRRIRHASIPLEV